MWALPTLSEIDLGNKNCEFFDNGGLWILIVSADCKGSLFDEIQNNWQLFDGYLGPDLHLITLAKKGGDKIEYSKTYSKNMGEFCRKFQLNIGKLPGLMLLNRNSKGEFSFLSLKPFVEHKQYDVLTAFIGDMAEVCRKTENLPGNRWGRAVDELVQIHNSKVSKLKVKSGFASAGAFMTSITPELFKSALEALSGS